MPFLGLTDKEKQQLELEVVPHGARLKITRLIRDACRCEDSAIELVRTQNFVNIASQVMEKPIYRLEPDYSGEEYSPADYAWLRGQRELIMRFPNTAELVEILADYLQERMLRIRPLNAILEEWNCGFRFSIHEDFRDDAETVKVEVRSVEEIDEADVSNQHPNIRSLVDRMDRAIEGKDPSGVIHASASIFETLAKEVVQNPNVNNQPLGGFFESYRQKSSLPKPIIDYILEVYQKRNTTPLAGHGSTTPPKISLEDAVTLAELTKAIIRTERQLSTPSIQGKRPTARTSTKKKTS